MQKFKRERREFGGGFNRFDHGRSDRGRDFDKPMFDAVCSNCGQDCRVPFKPTGQRDVLCNDCFRGGGRSDRKPHGFDRKPQTDGSARALEQLNLKVDRMLAMIEAIKASTAAEKPKHVLTVALNETKAEEASKAKAPKSNAKTSDKTEAKEAKASKKAEKETKPAKKTAAKKKK